MYKCIVVVIDELFKALRAPERRGVAQIRVIIIIVITMSGQNHLARHGERGKTTRQREREVGRQHQRMDGPGVRQVPEGSGEPRRMEDTVCEVICGAPTTPSVTGQVKVISISSTCCPTVSF